MNKLLYWTLIVLCVSCHSNRTDKFQRSRSIITDVQSKIVGIPMDSILIGQYAHVYILGDYLLIADDRSFDKAIHLFDKNNFQYLASTANRGEGPNEITMLGHIGTDDAHKKFYVTDHGKLKIFSFDVDSVIKYPDYMPSVKMRIKPENFPTEYTYINDTLCIGRTIVPNGTNDYTPYVSRWNMSTNEIIPISPTLDMKHKRITFAASPQYGLALELYTFYDRIAVFDFWGNLRCNIYGPQWTNNDSKRIHYYSNAVFCAGNKFIVSYSGGSSRNDEYYPTKLIAFTTSGNYIQTLDVGYKINHFCYDEDNNRLIFNFNDDIQFGYLDLDQI